MGRRTIDPARAGLSRRALLQSAAGWSAALALAACGAGEEHAPQAPAATPEIPAGTAAEGSGEMDWTRAGLDAIQEAMAAGTLSARSLTGLCLARIEAINWLGPELRAVLAVNPEALATADNLDAERAGGQVRGPLHGVPVLLKDNIDMAGLPTTAGALAMEGSMPPGDAPLTRRLREAGAVILGKANLSEWANFRSTRSTSGWSGVGGQCRNPFDPARSPCGSSSGSAVAVAAGMAPLAVGTETNGSIVCPSATNGVVGLKPTVGLVSRTGVVPISHTQDTAGPIGTCVADVAALLGALAGPDPEDPATAGQVLTDYTAALGDGDLSGVRIGVARRLMGFDERVDAALEAALEVLKGLGAIIVDPANLPHPAAMEAASFEVMLYEFKHGLEQYLARLPEPPLRTLDALIAWNEANREAAMPHFDQELLIAAAEKGPLTEAAYTEALETALRLAREEGLDPALETRRLDAIAGVSNGPAWMIDAVNGDHYKGGSAGYPAVAGYPHITVPMGQIEGLPVGLSLFGAAWSEATLLRIAYAYEQAAAHDIRPPI